MKIDVILQLLCEAMLTVFVHSMNQLVCPPRLLEACWNVRLPSCMICLEAERAQRNGVSSETSKLKGEGVRKYPSITSRTRYFVISTMDKKWKT